MYITHKGSSMLDMLLNSFNPLNFLQSQQEGQGSFNPLSMLQNPGAMFSGLGGEEGNPFGKFSGDFNPSILAQGSEGAEASGTQRSEAESEQIPSPEFPLPEEGVPKGDEPIDDKYKNADGSTKSADQIIKESPAAANFCKDKGDSKEIYDNSKNKFGDWEKEKDPEKAARSAIKFRQLAEFADNASNKNGEKRGEEAGNGNINGFTSSMEVRNGTEGAIMADYFRKGRQFIVDTHGDGVNTEGHLSATDDKYVRSDGSTRSDAGQFFVDVGNALGHIPLLGMLGNGIAGAADGIDRGAQKGDAGAAILGGFTGGFNGATHTLSTTMNGAASLAKGDFGSAFQSGASLLGMGESYTDTL